MSIGFTGTVDEVVDASRTWWADHGLTFPRVASQSVEPVVLAMGQSAFAFPAAEQQRAQLEAIVALGSFGGTASVVDSVVPAVAGRPDGPYLVILDEEIAEWSRGLTAPALTRALRQHGSSGLSVLEYLIVQRRAFEVCGDHRFDDYTGSSSGWTWLPASTSGPLHAMAYYYEKTDRVEISACKSGSKNPRKGAYTVQVTPLIAGTERTTP